MLKNLNAKTIILASQSPRRRDLLSDLGITFKVIAKPIKEDFPSEMNPHLIAEYLANKKSSVFHPKSEEIIITADTVVIHNSKVLNKPKNKEEAKENEEKPLLHQEEEKAGKGEEEEHLQEDVLMPLSSRVS